MNSRFEEASRIILTPEALKFVEALHLEFDAERRRLLGVRARRAEEIKQTLTLDFLKATESQRKADWKVAATPADLQDRRVEITGPTDQKMVINALNSGARVFMTDFEDSNSPTWSNMVTGQFNLYEANRRTLQFEASGKKYALKNELAVLKVRPRGWHLPETHLTFAGKSASGSLTDFGLYFFHNAAYLLSRPDQVGGKSGPYFYLPKLESSEEARLWARVFAYSEKALGIPHGSIKATVLIETITAAFEMDEILFELKDYIVGLNAGRWDYLFSCIKKFGHNTKVIFPDRDQLTMGVPFMRAYAELLVKTCHRRGAHAMGGMSAFIPSRKDPEVNANAMLKVREDKEREVKAGFDGTWVAHPDLVPVAKAIFDEGLGSKPNQKDKLREDVNVKASDLIRFEMKGSSVTGPGIRNNVSVSLQYISAWLGGTGAVAIFNLMEDAATAEISRAELWQWTRAGVLKEDRFKVILNEELTVLKTHAAADPGHVARLDQAARFLERLVLNDEFQEFLTLPLYEVIQTHSQETSL